MKIAILDMDDLKNPHWGSGQATATREIGKRLSKKNDIVVYCSKYPDSKDYKKDNIFYQHIGIGTKFAKVNNLFYLLALPFTVRKIKADIIIEHFTAPISTCFSPLFTKIPVVGLSSFFASGELSKKYGINFNLLERLGGKFYKYAVALNKSHAAKMKVYNPSIAVRIIPNGVDKKYLTMKAEEKNYILFIGRIDIFQKGLDMLIAAFKKAKEAIEDNLYIIGSGSVSEEKQLMGLIEKNNLIKRVKFLGRKTGKEKDDYLRKAKFAVFPSRYEGQSLSFLEMMALGKPIVCFDIAGLEWLEKCAIKVKALDVNNFAKNIIFLSKNKGARQAIGRRAKEQAALYTWDETAKQYEKFLLSIVN